MTEPSQYFKGRTVQEQMDEVIGYVDTRAAEVATTAIASDVAQVHQDMLDANADAQAAAASAAAAAGTLANAVKKTGEASQSIAGDITVASDLSAGGDLAVTGDAGVQGQLSVLGGCDLRAPVKIPVTPTNNDDAASKKYVDDHHDATKINITAINSYAVGLTGNQTVAGIKTHTSQIAIEKSNDASFIDLRRTTIDRTATQNSYIDLAKIRILDANNKDMFWLDSYVDAGDRRVIQIQVFNSDGTANGYIQFINTGSGVKSINTNFPKPTNW